MVDRRIDTLLRAQEKAIGGLGQAWDLLLKTTGSTSVPGARAATERLQEAVAALVSVAAYAAEPIQALATSQRELADRLERWADLQRETADVLAGLAAQQRLTADLLGATVAPLLGRPDAPPR